MIKTVAWAGNAYFASAMRSLCAEVVCLPRNRTLDWEAVLQTCGHAPDLFVYGDISAQPFLKGIEAFPCPTVFYAIDTHIHSWYPLYAQAFDLVCVAMRDHLAGFLELGVSADRIRWLPLFAKDSDSRIEMGGALRNEIVFVGKNDPVLTPGRHHLLSELGKRVPLVVRQGKYAEFYSQFKLVLNVSEHMDLNFRVFEALGCGACLITPHVGHGLEDLFQIGEDLFTYNPDDLSGLVELIRQLLADDVLRAKVADAGMQTVHGRHQCRHRAQEFWEWIQAFDLQKHVAMRLGQNGGKVRMQLRRLYLHFAESETEPVRRNMYLDWARLNAPE